MGKEVLESYLALGYSTRRIVEESGLAQTTVRYWLKKYNLKAVGTGFTKKWTDNELIDAVKTNSCAADIMRALGLKTTGTGNYETLDRHAKRLNLIIPRGYKIPVNTKNRTASDKMFYSNSSISRSTIKRQLLSEGLGTTCNICKQSNTWLNKPLVLILDHINGINNDNRRENLQFVCPNCNSQLSTHCKKNKTGV